MADQNNGGAGAPVENPFLATLPEEFRADPALKDIKDIGGLTKGYINAQSMVGKDKLIMPGEKATPEEWGAFYQRLGRPEKPEGYEFKDDTIPEQIYGRQEILQEMRTAMHAAGIPKKAAEAIFGKYGEVMNKHFKALTDKVLETRNASIAQLQKEWGADYEKNMAVSKAAVKKFDTTGEFAKYLDETKLGDDPRMIKYLNEVAKNFGPDKIIGGGDGGTGGDAQQEAMAKLEAQKKDPEFVKSLMEKNHPKHKENSAERSRLFAIAYPGQVQN